MPAAPKRPCSTAYCPHFKPCPVHAKQETRQRDTKTVNERKFYSSGRWTQLSIRHRQEEPFCRTCLKEKRYVLGQLTDHILAIRDGGDPWQDSNLQTLCNPCHNRKRQQERNGVLVSNSVSVSFENRRFPQNLPRSRIPIALVCGPPGSGKSTYVREHAGPRDLVICLDEIQQRLTGLPEHHTGMASLGAALDERNTLLRSLEFETRFDFVWFVISLPVPSERERWASMLGARIVLMDTPLEECIRRIEADPARVGHTERMKLAARAWWEGGSNL